MALAITGGAAEAAALDESALATEALSEAALLTDPAAADALATEAVATPSPLPTTAVLDEDAMFRDLVELRAVDDPTAAYLAYLAEHVTDAPAFVWFLGAAYRSQVEPDLVDCPLDLQALEAGAAAVAETFGPFVLGMSMELTGVLAPGTSLNLLLAAHPGIATNAHALVTGLLQGIGESGVASADTIRQVIEANAALTVVLPLHAVCFIAGTIYQILRDIYDTVAAIVAAVGYLDDVIPFACRLLSALPMALERLLDAESAGDVALLGRYVGQLVGSALAQDVPRLDAAATWSQVAVQLVEFSFTLGTWFGPILLDILLMFVGIGYIEAAIKLLGKALTYAADAVDWIFTLLRRLLDAVDPGLCDDLIAFGAKVAGRLDVRLGELADAAEAAYGFSKVSIENGLAAIERALKSDGYRAYTCTMFCSLEP